VQPFFWEHHCSTTPHPSSGQLPNAHHPSMSHLEQGDRTPQRRECLDSVEKPIGVAAMTTARILGAGSFWDTTNAWVLAISPARSRISPVSAYGTDLGGFRPSVALVAARSHRNHLKSRCGSSLWGTHGQAVRRASSEHYSFLRRRGKGKRHLIRWEFKRWVISNFLHIAAAIRQLQQVAQRWLFDLH
jgi:hypothetical protein